MRIQLLRDHWDQNPQAEDLSWPELVDKLRSPVPAPAEKSQLPAWIPAHLENGKRGNHNVKEVCALCLDCDKLTPEQWMQVQENLKGQEYVWHTTYSHDPTPGAQAKYRVVVRLSRAVRGLDWKAFYKASAEALTGNAHDGSTCDATRLFYLPAATPHFESGHVQGEPWPVDEVLAHIEETRDAYRTRVDIAKLSDLLNEAKPTKTTPSFTRRGYETLVKLLDPTLGEYAPTGLRDSSLYAAAVWLSRRLPTRGTDLQQIVDACRPGFDIENCRHKEGDTFLEKLERAFSEVEAEQRAVIDDPVRLAQMDRTGVGEYTGEEIDTWLQQQRLPSKAHLTKQLVVVHRSNYYVFSKGDYIYAGTKDTGEKLAMQELELCAPIGFESGNPGAAGLKPRTWKDIVKTYGVAVRNVKPSLAIEHSYVDWTTSTLMHAVCPRRGHLKPQYDEAVERWLARWGDDTLLDWLATAPRLTKATSALFLKGAPDSGKTMLAKGLAAIWGDAPTKMSNLGLNFNDAVAKNPVVFADESVPEIYRKDSGLLREMITAESISLNRKYMEPVDLQGAVRVIICKNNLTMFSGESMTREDVEAVSRRILYYRVDEKAPYFEPNRLARHILWLELTRADLVPADYRLWVVGRDSELHRHMRISSRDRSLVCQFVLEMLQNPGPVRDLGHTMLSLRNGVALTPSVVYRRWETYLAKERQLDVRQIAQVLQEIGVKNEKGLYDVNLEDLQQWATAHSYPSDIHRLIESALGQIQKTAN